MAQSGSSNAFLPIAYHQGEFLPFDEAKVSIATHALHYGTAAFGGMRGVVDVQDPRRIHLFRLDAHVKRLSASGRLLGVDIAGHTIAHVIVELVKRNRPNESFYLRPLIYVSDLGLSPRLHAIERDILVYGLTLGDYLPAEGVSCRVSSWQRQTDVSMPLRGKISGGYVTSALAKTEAVCSGFDEAILLNSQGKVCEATATNIFLVRNGILITPGVNQDILEGITRDSVIRLAREMGIPVEERAVDRSELLIADEAFLTGSAARITPVRQIETYHLPQERPITNRLREVLTAIYQGNDGGRGWVTTVVLPSSVA